MQQQRRQVEQAVPGKRRKMDTAKTRVVVCESMPEGMTYPQDQLLPPIFDEWQTVLAMATKSIDIAAFYVTLRATSTPGHEGEPHPSSWQGEAIFDALMDAGKKRGVKIRIALNKQKEGQKSADCEDLKNEAGAEVRELDFPKLVGSGILHTKFIIVDNVHFYVGSANMDWRSLTQVKEVGACVYNHPVLAADIAKIFDVYWMMGFDDAAIPPSWPPALGTAINAERPLSVDFEPGDQSADIYLASSPDKMCPGGRTVDVDAILKIIDEAEEFVYVCVMDYFPSFIFKDRDEKFYKYWPVIDDRLRRAAFERGVKVRLMASWWENSRSWIIDGLNSLQACDHHIETKLFKVPSTWEQKKINHARVNHNKYMITEKTAYIGTSNWTGDYFVYTGGVGLVFNQAGGTSASVRQQLKAVFERDWFSENTSTMPPHGWVFNNYT